MVIGKIADAAGKINQDTGKIHFSEDFSGETSETVEESETSRYRGQRGHDKFDIKVHAKSILNLEEDQKEIQGAGDKALMLSCRECYFMALYDLNKISKGQ